MEHKIMEKLLIMKPELNEHENRLLSYLREHAYDYYQDEYKKGNLKDRQFVALLQSLTVLELARIACQMEIDAGCPRSLYYKVQRVLENKWELATVRPFKKLIDLYIDKNSMKVGYASNALKKQYDEISQEKQHEVLCAFLDTGSKGDREWAARRLRDNWIESMDLLVAKAWRAHHDRVLSFVVLRHMPDAFVLEQQEELAAVAGYRYVCARLGGVKGFKMDESKLTVTEWFYAVAKSGLKVSKDELELRLEAYLKSEFFDHEDVRRLLWAMGRLGMTDELMSLQNEWPERIKPSFYQDDFLDMPYEHKKLTL
jgi:hypothetical protein